MKTYILNLSDPASVRIWDYNFKLGRSNYVEMEIICTIPTDTNCLKVIGTIDFHNVGFNSRFYEAIKGNIDILDLSELKSAGSYRYLSLGLDVDGEYAYERHKLKCLSFIKEIILPDRLENLPMIRGFQELKKIVGLGLTALNIENKTGSSNLSNCPKLEEIIFGSTIMDLSIRYSSIKKISIPESNGLLQLEPYGLAYNKELEEVHLPQDMKELPIRLFEGCTKLRTITGGNGIEEIRFGAFGGCTNLNSVPFRKELLKENQFISYDEWMQYEPTDHQTRWWVHEDCAHCPKKGIWSERRHKWESGCNLKKYYCRDNEQRKWKPYKKCVVLKNGDIWCFNDFTYYKTDTIWWHKPQNMHKYVEFISPSITFTQL